MLKSFYTKHAKKNKIEIIYVSSDRDVESFRDYYGKMPWLAIPAEGTSDIKNHLAQQLVITGIPTLIVLNKEGKFLSNTGREEVTKVGDSVAEANKLIAMYKEKEALPLDQVKAATAAQSNFILSIVMMILKNPMYIFGMLYFFKFAMRKLSEYGRDGEEDDGGAAEAATASETSEF